MRRSLILHSGCSWRTSVTASEKMLKSPEGQRLNQNEEEPEVYSLKL